MSDGINIKYRKNAVNNLLKYKYKKYQSYDIKLKNVNLMGINLLIRLPMFRKNYLFVDSDTLFDLMQDKGGKGKHNYHGLTPEIILDVLSDVEHPICIYEEDYKKYAIISSTKVESGEPLMLIIQIDAPLYNNPKAEEYKFVTMFPKSKADNLIQRKLEEHKVLYLNYLAKMKKGN